MAIAIDPVCGMEVETEGALLTFEYQGTTYYFCSKGCLLDFKDDPEHYLPHDDAPTGADRPALGARERDTCEVSRREPRAQERRLWSTSWSDHRRSADAEVADARLAPCRSVARCDASCCSRSSRS